MAELTAALGKLLYWLEKYNRPVLSALQPGLTAEEFRRYEEGLPFHLPQEVRELYAWRNGTRKAPELRRRDVSFVGSSYDFLSLQDAMRLHLECPFNEEDEIVPTDPGFEHLSDPTLWLSLFDNDCGDSLCVYCSDADTDTTPVMDYVHDGEPRVAFGSLTLMITTLCAWFEAGVYTPDEDGWLEVDYDLQRKIARSLNPGLRRWQDNPFDACS